MNPHGVDIETAAQTHENLLLDQWLPVQPVDSEIRLTNQPSLDLPFQRWFKFKEAFTPQFILDCSKRLGKTPKSCIDPFGGSGTTALTAQFLGISPTTIEVNPFLADLIEAKLTQYDAKLLQFDYMEVIRRSRRRVPRVSEILKDAPKTLVEPGVKGRWIFSSDAASKIIALRLSIEALPNAKNKRLLLVVLGSILIGVSNAIVNGKGRRYRRNWEDKESDAASVEAAFRESFFDVYSDICQYSGRRTCDFKLHRGDSRKALDKVGEFDFAAFSPPYPNSFDYTDIYNIELWMLGYMSHKADNSNLRKATLRSHVQISREYSTSNFGSQSLMAAYSDLQAVRGELWNSNIPEMVCAYFEDMRTILQKLKTKSSAGAKMFLAVGNSKYAGVMIDTETILKEIALSSGYSHAESEPVRSMRSSAQQGGARELTESLITLSK
jgi:hypothetical protein